MHLPVGHTPCKAGQRSVEAQVSWRPRRPHQVTVAWALTVLRGNEDVGGLVQALSLQRLHDLPKLQIQLASILSAWQAGYGLLRGVATAAVTEVVHNSDDVRGGHTAMHCSPSHWSQCRTDIGRQNGGSQYAVSRHKRGLTSLSMKSKAASRVWVGTKPVVALPM